MKMRTVVRIRNTRHKQTFLSDLHSFWNNSCYADAVLVGKTKSGSPFKSVPVNKSILAAVSHKFAQLLTNTEDDVNLIFPETDFVIIESFVSFIYSGEIILNAEDYRSIGEALKSFFSEWDVYFPEAISENNVESNSLCRGNARKCDHILNEKHGSSTSRVEESPVSTEKDSFQPKSTEDQPANSKKQPHRTSTRKSKKPEKLVETVSITPDSSVLNHCSPIDLQNCPPLSTFDKTSSVTGEKETIPGHSEKLCQEVDQTSVPVDSNLSEMLPEVGKKRNKQPSCLLDIPTEEVNKHATTQDTPTKPKRLPCTICGKEVSADSITNHLKLHSNERPYLCELCGASFVLSGRLRRHMKLTHSHNQPQPQQPQTYTCKTCGKNFDKVYNLKRHERLHLGLKPNTCPFCDKSFRLRNALTEHIRVHTGEKPFECGVCQRRFTNQSNYSAHLRRHEKGIIPINSEASSFFDAEASLYRCTMCGATFQLENPFLAHLAAHRGEEAKLPCKYCLETFPSYKVLKEHKIEKHSDALYKCEECPAIFTTSTRLRHHAIAHKEGKKSRCSVCSRFFRTLDELIAHKLSSHSKNMRIDCKMCGKEFKTSLRLKAHFKEVHLKVPGEKGLKSDVRPYQCAYCPKAFPHDSHLANHVRIHTGEKPFLCAVCGKSFRMKNNLAVHMKIHTGEKIQCETCGKTFKSFVKLKQHEYTHRVDEDQLSHVSAL